MKLAIFNKYRPVSILPQFSKVIEKLFEKRLNTFIDKHNLLAESQYGFRAGRSTAMALADLVEDITTAIDQKLHAIGVFIDLKKAFDTINHELLLLKLQCYGIRGVVNEWISNYLTNRRQYVQINEYASDFLNIRCGVPQGSILGPNLFILYINDICKVSDIAKFVLFADDTNILCTGHDIQYLSSCVCKVLEELNIWFMFYVKRFTPFFNDFHFYSTAFGVGWWCGEQGRNSSKSCRHYPREPMNPEILSSAY